jgi:phosphonate transport system permease protein
MPPDFSVSAQVWQALLETGRMAVLATCFAGVLAFMIAPLAARTISPRWLVHPMRLFLNFVRSIPSLVWALLAVAVVGANALAGVIALTFYSLGYLGKFFSDSFEAVDTRPAEALRAAGAHPVQAFQYGLWPEVKPLIWSHTLWMLEYNVRAGTIIATWSGGIGTLLYTLQEFYQWNKFAAVLCFILVIVTADLPASRLRSAQRQQPFTHMTERIQNSSTDSWPATPAQGGRPGALALMRHRRSAWFRLALCSACPGRQNNQSLRRTWKSS